MNRSVFDNLRRQVIKHLTFIGFSPFIPNSCWVSFTNNLVWTFVTPVLAVCLVSLKKFRK